MLKLYTYHIPFRSAFGSAGNVITHREGIILVYRDKDSGIEAYGEVAPLPGFSEESFEEVKEVLLLNKAHLEEAIIDGSGQETLRLLDQIHRFPSLSFGIDTLLYDLAAKRSNKPLVQYLFPGFHSSIQSNGTLPLSNTSATLSKADTLTSEGFTTLKVKVGSDFNNELSVLSSLREKYPDIKIRIDANQAWTVDEAITHLTCIEELDIEYCEQPVHKENIAGLKKVTEASPIKIAADESARNKTIISELTETHAADLLIFKPMLMGTFNDIFVTKELADTHSIETVFTTSLETAIGRAAIAAISAGLGRYERAQGLATGSFLKHDVASEKWLNLPVIKFPYKIGLGISLHYEGLKEL
ncbi:o-succinylbenzoate synthase [Gracilimonas halophila]|uniref:o-succinylbenzoate synthase n=1 Tax=Gracilimonas halophila TaxID=1834464 RepID=A0ABW5JJX4_9BACT